MRSCQTCLLFRGSPRKAGGGGMQRALGGADWRTIINRGELGREGGKRGEEGKRGGAGHANLPAS